MSNIYVQEPPSEGKVLLTTSLGEIEIELWSKECPKAARNFVQLCLEGFYNGTIFHRVVPNFIAQGGDPTGSGHGGESIYGEPFRNEVHSRLRFVRRGLVATANTGNNDNESQFFFTLGACPELQNKHTIFGKVEGNTLFNMIKFNDLDIDREERPTHPPKIIKTEVINNPFPDIVPRCTPESKEKQIEDKKPKVKGTKNLKLLSFGEEEEESEQSMAMIPKLKGKSSHDLITNDPTLSAVPAIESDERSADREEKQKEQLERIQSKLKKSSNKEVEDGASKQEGENSDDEKKRKAQEKLASIKKEIKSLKRQMKATDEDAEEESKKKTKDPEHNSEDESNEVLKDFHMQQKKYAEMKKTRPGKGSEREAATLALLQKFQQKLSGVRNKAPEEAMETNQDDDDDLKNDDSWLAHTLKSEEQGPTLARDANMKGDDWFEITDPRNPINKRRREESKKTMKAKGVSSKDL